MLQMAWQVLSRDKKLNDACQIQAVNHDLRRLVASNFMPDSLTHFPLQPEWATRYAPTTPQCLSCTLLVQTHSYATMITATMAVVVWRWLCGYGIGV